MKYCFVVPVFNHPHHLVALLSHLSVFELPIIMINDGSDIACTEVLHQLAMDYPLVDLVEHTHNMGKGQAVMTGLKHAFECGFSHALQLDADGQHDWQDVKNFLETSYKHPEAMVIGQPIFDETVPKKRLYGRYLTHIWVWINSLSLEIKDSMCGFRIYPLVQTVHILNTAKFQPRMGFDSEILVRLKWKNVPFINIPTHVIYPENGISHFDIWRDNIGLARAHSRLFCGMLIRLPQLIYKKIKD